MSSIQKSWFLGLCWTFCHRFQVVFFWADLAQFWGGPFGGVWRGCPTT